MFEPVRSWSLPDHMYLVSAWSAKCRDRSPISCHNSINPASNTGFNAAVRQELAIGTTRTDLAWTGITWLLHAHHVSWAYYVQEGTQSDCANDAESTCPPVRQSAATPGIWNPHAGQPIKVITDANPEAAIAQTPWPGAEARGFEPRKGVNPNRISSAAP